MSLPATEREDATRFFGPLEGKVSILLFRDTRSKILVSNFILRCAQSSGEKMGILDVDAFYCTQINALSSQIAQCFLEDTDLILLPEHGPRFEPRSLSFLSSSKYRVAVVDGLNSLYSIASKNTRSHELMTLMRFLSFNVRGTGSKVIATGYRSDWVSSTQQRTPRSLEAFGDLVIDVEPQGDGSVVLRPRAGYSGWMNNEFLVGNYLDV